MKFGVRDICDVVFKAKNDMNIGTMHFKMGQPVFYIDTATASTLEQSTTQVYARGGKGNTKLVTWEGEKELTFKVTDALLSPVSFAILSGANIIKGTDGGYDYVHIHQTAMSTITINDKKATIDLSSQIGSNYIDPTAPVYICVADEDQDFTGQILEGFDVADAKSNVINADESTDIVKVASDGKPSFGTAGGARTSETDLSKGVQLVCNNFTDSTITSGTHVFVDFYTIKKSSAVQEMQISATSFGGNFYVEASTLFRRRYDGLDAPAEITLPNVKIQSNFTFNMAATGDPSTFDFIMDAMPGYTIFDNSKKIMCAIQTIDDADAVDEDYSSVMGHYETEALMETGEGDSKTAIDSVSILTKKAATGGDVTPGDGD